MSNLKRKKSEIVSPTEVTRVAQRRLLANMSLTTGQSTLSVAEAADDGSSQTVESIDKVGSAIGPDPTYPEIPIPMVSYQPSAGGTFDMTNFVLGLMANPVFINVISTHLTPVLTQSLSATVSTEIRTSVNEAVRDAFKSLENRLDDVSKRVDDNRQTIGNLFNTNDALAERVTTAEQSFSDMEAWFDRRAFELQSEIEELEQYGRRNSLRFHNVKYGDSDDTDDVIVDLCKSKLDVEITKDDICRSHPVGRKNRNKTRQIICRFRNWKIKNSIYSQKKSLKEDPDHVFITEDLTSHRQAIVNEIVKAKRAGKVSSFWTNDGRIFIKTPDSDYKQMIRSIDDLNYYAPPSDEFNMEHMEASEYE